MKPLTDRQLEAMLFIQDEVRRCGSPPSIRELADYLGISSTNGAADHLNALMVKGYIEPVRRQAARSLRILVHVDEEGLPIDVEQRIERVKQMFRDRCGHWPEAERAVDELVEVLR